MSDEIWDQMWDMDLPELARWIGHHAKPGSSVAETARAVLAARAAMSQAQATMRAGNEQAQAVLEAASKTEQSTKNLSRASWGLFAVTAALAGAQISQLFT